METNFHYIRENWEPTVPKKIIYHNRSWFKNLFFSIKNFKQNIKSGEICANKKGFDFPCISKYNISKKFCLSENFSHYFLLIRKYVKVK
jgi:hypothetical protein